MVATNVTGIAVGTLLQTRLKLKLLGVTIETSHRLLGIEIHSDFYYEEWSLVTPRPGQAEEATSRSTIKGCILTRWPTWRQVDPPTMCRLCGYTTRSTCRFKAN